MRIKSGKRLLALSMAALLSFMALAGRLYQVQVVKGPVYARMAHSQRTLSLPVASERGMILDRHGAPLTDPQPSWGVAVFPPLVDDPVRVLRALDRVGIQILEPQMRRLLDRREPIWLETGLTDGQATAVEVLGLKGIAVGPVGDRYGAGALARHLIGYADQSGGRQGLELAFDEQLGGSAVPTLVAYLDGRGGTMDGLGIRTVLPGGAKAPYNLHTTIDGRIQQAVEQVLDGFGRAGARALRGSVVVMDPATGEILAMASRPQYDPNRVADVLDSLDGNLLNRAMMTYPPGSVFKAIVAAAALEGNLVTPEERFDCDGHYTIGGHQFTEQGGGHGPISFAEAVARSCNVAFLQIGYERLGIEALQATALRYGLGAPTGLLGRPSADDPAGMVPDSRAHGAVQMAFGQGELAATPLQVARAFAAIASGGVLPPVRLVTAVKSPAGEVMERPPAGQGQRVMKRETARTLQRMLLGVTDPRGIGTGRLAWIGEGGSAGKTGSAQGVMDGKPAVHAWFAGYMPVVAPRYVIAVMVEGGGGGGDVAAPIFREVGRAIQAATAGN